MVRASCGTQTYGGDDDGATLLDRADNAMYHRKRTKTGPHGRHAGRQLNRGDTADRTGGS